MKKRASHIGVTSNASSSTTTTTTSTDADSLLDVPSEPILRSLSSGTSSRESDNDESLTMLSRYLRIWLFALILLFGMAFFVLLFFRLLSNPSPGSDSFLLKKSDPHAFTKRAATKSHLEDDDDDVVNILLSQIQDDYGASKTTGGDVRSTFYHWNGKRSRPYNEEACPEGFLAKNRYCWGKQYNLSNRSIIST